MPVEIVSRREILAGAATFFLAGELAAAVVGNKTFTILHTNDLHSNLIGLGPAAEYSPFNLNDDKTQWRIRTSGHDDRKAERRT